ncbi:hypothetical protein CONLIGDRAFT_628020 [Coniochaeta ligniaria NRRL 30616]|uniref:Peptidase S8/S53 domain-containing protein n=1 Tax=Coniochaeta ligniaria NRRL 30616 TaxID=1408157 RepID=A0A1J7J033_9PEZI|nr:hypothetical protein CONLIGDRAFT_628020 [Coniochaeta ligniaria NRRL 30616]
MDKLVEFCWHIDRTTDHKTSRRTVPEPSLDIFSPRVAMVGDGVSIAEFSSREELCIVEGHSFVSSESQPKHWFFSTTGHGTAMARIVSALTPKARMFVVRTDFGLGRWEESFTKVGDTMLDSYFTP